MLIKNFNHRHFVLILSAKNISNFVTRLMLFGVTDLISLTLIKLC